MIKENIIIVTYIVNIITKNSKVCDFACPIIICYFNSFNRILGTSAGLFATGILTLE